MSARWVRIAMNDRLAESVGARRVPPRRVRLKADGRIVEILPDGSERMFADAARPSAVAAAGEATADGLAASANMRSLPSGRKIGRAHV